MTRRPQRKRELSEEERRLWEQAMRETTALPSRRRAAPAREEQKRSGERPAQEAFTAGQGSARQQAESRRIAQPSQQPSDAHPQAATPPTTPLARREARRIARDSQSIDARLDLHGMRQREAYPALKGFLRASQARGHRLVLVITGKGTARELAASEYDDWEATPFYEAPRGVLRRLVPEWLARPEFRDVVAVVSPAHPRHGGEGALYIRLRRLAPQSASRPRSKPSSEG